MDYRKIITIEPDKRGGRPCIRGMRISVYDILGWLAAGMSNDEIIAEYPELTADDIRAAPAVTNGEETILGTTYDTVSIPWKDQFGATRVVVFLSKTSHLPARRVTFAGETIVRTEDFLNVNASANLTESDF